MNPFPLAYLVQRDGKDVILPARTMSVFEAFATQYGRKPLFNIPFYKNQESTAACYEADGKLIFVIAPYTCVEGRVYCDLYLRPEEPVVFGMTQADIEKFMQCDDTPSPQENYKSFMDAFNGIFGEVISQESEHTSPTNKPDIPKMTTDAVGKKTMVQEAVKEITRLTDTIKKMSEEKALLTSELSHVRNNRDYVNVQLTSTRAQLDESRLQRDDALAKLNAANEKLERVRLAILKANNG